MKRYSKYKDSGLPWLGEIPEHWEVRRLKFLTKHITDGEHISPNLTSEGILLLSAKDIRDREIIYNVNKFVSIEDAKKFWLRCQPRIKDILIVSRGATIGRVAIVEHQTPFCLMGSVILCHLKSETISIFIYFALNSNYAQKSLFFSSAASAQPAIYIIDIAELAIPLPPLPEQKAIAQFIDRKLVQIDQFIKNKQRLIELLKELKTAIINHAVTKGLNPDVPMKPSGIEWLGDIPEGWGVLPIKRTLQSYDYGLSESIKGEGEFKVLTMGHIQDGRVLIPEYGNLKNVSEELVLDYGDLLFNRTNSPDLVGKVGIFQGTKEDKVTFASYLVRLKPNEYAESAYLNLFLNSHFLLSKARQQALLSLHQANLNATKYCRMLIALPPIYEQKLIIQFIKNQSSKIDLAITKAEKEIELIQEYRTTLISDAVTGKIDVRKTADNS